MSGQTRKLTIRCLMCDEGITELSSPDFAEPNITANLGHLEYRIIVEMPSSIVQYSKPTLVFDDAEKH